MLGIPPYILDRVLLESFEANRSLALCTLIKLPSTISSSATRLTESLITLEDKLSDVELCELLIIETPTTSMSLGDLKAAYLLLKKVRCCFDLSNVKVLSTELDGLTQVLTVEISSMEHGHCICLIHHATAKTDGTYTVCSATCNVCKENLCEVCSNCRTCEICAVTSCEDCMKSTNCFGFQFCEDCDEISCKDCMHECCNCNRTKCDKCNDDYFWCCKCRSEYCNPCGSDIAKTATANCGCCINNLHNYDGSNVEH